MGEAAAEMKMDVGERGIQVKMSQNWLGGIQVSKSWQNRQFCP